MWTSIPSRPLASPGWNTTGVVPTAFLVISVRAEARRRRRLRAQSVPTAPGACPDVRRASPIRPRRRPRRGPSHRGPRRRSPITPITDLSDPRAITILSTEHWSLLSARSLAYNEAFVRGGMFLTFLSMSFVALALLSQAMTFGNQFLIVGAILMAFVFVIGLTAYGRISGASVDDLRAMHGMASIRHAYTEVAAIVAPYFTTAVPQVQSGMESRFPAPRPPRSIACAERGRPLSSDAAVRSPSSRTRRR